MLARYAWSVWHTITPSKGRCGERIKPAPAPKKQRKKPAEAISSRPSTILCSLIISHLFLKNITVF
nr:MAG TPA: hypothetical protein [Caudoviricetes sp.]